MKLNGKELELLIRACDEYLWQKNRVGNKDCTPVEAVKNKLQNELGDRIIASLSEFNKIKVKK